VLKSLKIKNVALIEIIEINFEKGLNVFTGDSGSGKSLILDSLNTLFGGSNIPPNHLIRPGTNECSIEAVFTNTQIIKNWLIKNKIPTNLELLKVRRLSTKKNTKISNNYFVNNFKVSKKIIISLGTLLLDFSGQNDSFLLRSQDYLRSIIDELGSNELTKINNAVRKEWKKMNLLKKEINISSMKLQKAIENHFASTKILKILDDANLGYPNEIETLKSEQIKLANNVELSNSVEFSLSKLNDYGHEISSVTTLIFESLKKLNRVIQYDQSINDFTEKLTFIQEQVDELIVNLSNYLNSVDNREDSLKVIQDRLFKLQNLEKTFSLELPDLIKKRDELRDISSEENCENKLKTLNNQFQKTSEVFQQCLNIQSSKRKLIANQLIKNVTATLKFLGLKNASFNIEILDTEFSENGKDNISFLFSANPDQDLAPIHKVISGGEMSRFLLALKSNISKTSETIFLDEIDSGLSGDSLKFLIRLIRDISKKQQILCITHQPNLAACADVHFKVQKRFQNGLTYTNLTCLKTKKQRQNELVQLIGGGFDEASDYALTLLNKAAA